ncbi:MAG TPA: hypothetical protein VF891_00725 [Gaiellaceae bacterium]
MSVRFVVLGFVLAGTFAWGGSASPRAPSDPPPRAAFATVRLHPLPLQALNQCRLARAIAFCPRRLPLASLPGWRAPRGTPPPILVAQRYRPFRDGRARLVGVSFGYGAPWEPDSGPDWRQHLWRNRPCCFLHFELYRAIKGTPPMAAHVERAPLGGRSGLLAAAAGYGLGCDGPFFCNHLRFYWRERGSWYVATLHHFGVPETRTLLDRLVRELRPVRTLQPGRPHVVATIRIGGFPNALAVGDGTVWIVGGGRRSGRIVRIDQSSNRVAARIRAPVGSERSCGIATAGGSVWAAAYDPGSRRTTVLRIDPKRARIVGRIPIPNAACVTAAAGAVWVSSPESRTLTRIEPKSGRVVAHIRKAGSYPEGIAFGYGSVWVASGTRPCGSPRRPCTPSRDTSGQLTRIDARTNLVVARLRLEASPAYVAAAAGNVWVSSNDGTIRRIDPHTNRLAGPPLPVSGGRVTLAAGLGLLWVTSITGPGRPGTITPVDPRRGTLGRSVTVGRSPLGMASRAGSLWVANFNSGTVSRIVR